MGCLQKNKSLVSNQCTIGGRWVITLLAAMMVESRVDQKVVLKDATMASY